MLLLQITERRESLSLYDVIHRNNIAAALINGTIGPKAQYSQVHPFLCHDGRAPQDFQIPRTVESMRILDSKTAGIFFFLDIKVLMTNTIRRSTGPHSAGIPTSTGSSLG